MNLRNELNKMDHRALENNREFYDLVSLYDASLLTDGEKKKLVESIERGNSRRCYSILSENFNKALNEARDLRFVDNRKGAIVRGDDDYGYDEYDVKDEDSLDDVESNQKYYIVDFVDSSNHLMRVKYKSKAKAIEDAEKFTKVNKEFDRSYVYDLNKNNTNEPLITFYRDDYSNTNESIAEAVDEDDEESSVVSALNSLSSKQKERLADRGAFIRRADEPKTTHKKENESLNETDEQSFLKGFNPHTMEIVYKVYKKGTGNAKDLEMKEFNTKAQALSFLKFHKDEIGYIDMYIRSLVPNDEGKYEYLASKLVYCEDLPEKENELLQKELPEDLETEAVDDDTPYSKEQVEATLRDLTNDYTDKNDTVRCYYKEEKDAAQEILQKYYEIVEVSVDDRIKDEPYYVISYSKPKGNKDIKESASDRFEDRHIEVIQIIDGDEEVIEVFDENEEDRAIAYAKENEGDKVVLVAQTYDLDSNGLPDKFDVEDIKVIWENDNTDPLRDSNKVHYGKEYPRKEVLNALKDSFNDRAVFLMDPHTRITIGLANLIENETGKTVEGVDWEEQNGKIYVTDVFFAEEENESLDEDVKEQVKTAPRDWYKRVPKEIDDRFEIMKFGVYMNPNEEREGTYLLKEKSTGKYLVIHLTKYAPVEDLLRFAKRQNLEDATDWFEHLCYRKEIEEQSLTEGRYDNIWSPGYRVYWETKDGGYDEEEFTEEEDAQRKFDELQEDDNVVYGSLVQLWERLGYGPLEDEEIDEFNFRRDESLTEESSDEYDRIEIDYLVTNGKDSEYFGTEDEAIDFATTNGWDEIYKITTKYKNGRYVDDTMEPIDW